MIEAISVVTSSSLKLVVSFKILWKMLVDNFVIATYINVYICT